MEARYYNIEDKNGVTCLLCPHNCLLNRDNKGICGVRVNSNGVLKTLVYGNISGYGVDPIEKKPLYHFYPGSNILSVGSFGCNLSCNFCQNHSISQVRGNIPNSKSMSPDKVVKDALSIDHNAGIAFTYNEPTVWYEFMSDTAVLAKKNNLSTVMVSNGYINSEPLNTLTDVIDAFNIDLKSFDDNFYKRQCKAGLAPVLETIKTIYESGRHLELTWLVIPTLNDDADMFREAMEWIIQNTGTNTVLHLSRYFPMYRSVIPATPATSIIKLRKIALEYLSFVYTGNMHETEGNNTECPNCGSVVTTRTGYTTKQINLDSEGKCSGCGTLIYSFFIP